jgi:transmembrane sensor
MEMNVELLYRFFSQKTTSEEEKRIQRWLEESNENRDELFRQRKVFDAIILQGNLKSDKSVIYKYINFSYKRIAITISTIAACILITLAITTSVLNSSYRKMPMNMIIVPQGQRVNMVLADGTNVWLNANTRMEYPQSFKTLKERRVKIDGEAYFDVSKDKKHPFIVETKKGEIEAKGTKFYVSAYSHSEFFETALMEGKVIVRAFHEYAILLPHQKAVMEGGHLICQNIDYYDTYQWKDGLYCFRDLSIRQVLARFEVYYDVHFIIKKKLPDTKITGKFRLVDGIDYALNVLQLEVKFAYQRDNSSNIIYIK